MLRGGPQVSAQDNKQQQQKQKKRLSFKDPEVEGPLKNSFYAGCRSKTLGRPTKPTNTRKASYSVEDLTLEDQALQIAQNVGNAFSNLSKTDNEQANYLDVVPPKIEALKETEIRDTSPTDIATYQRSCQLRSFKITTEDQEYLDSVIPPLLDLTMRGPSVENSDPNLSKNCIPSESNFHEVRSTSSTQHQIQLLKYQLDQQNQQTQMALHQIQLLQDQLNAESSARRKAQEQNNLIMQQNKELLNHIEKLFQQIEELEKQIGVLEQEKRGKRLTPNQESQVSLYKQTSSFGNQRLSSEKTVNESSTLQTRSQYTATRKGSLTSTKPLTVTSKISTTQNSSVSANRKTPAISQRSFIVQSKNKDSGTKENETLRIGDTSPPVQSETASPFSSAWKLKSTDSSNQSNIDKATGSAIRGRAGSFSSYVKKPQEGSTTKSTLFGSSSSSNLSSTSITSKKHSSSTSDLYNTPSTLQRKSSLVIEEPSTNAKTAISNLSLSATSKLPRYQHYTSWQRRTSLTSDNEPASTISKDSYKSSTQTSLFNR